jgi:hypothetical protein
MELVERHHLPVHQVLPQLQVPQGQRLDRSEPKVRLEQPAAQVPELELEQQAQPVLAQAELALE